MSWFGWFLSNDGTSLFQAMRRLSTAASVVVGPKLMRMAPRASAGSTAMAASTCEAATLPEEQAEPDDTARPLRSKAISAVSALIPDKASKVVFGRRGAA